MASFVDNLRNIALVGGQGTGKTSLIEAILYEAKLITKMGNIKEGNTISDYDSMEKKRSFSINPSLLYLEWQNHKINLLDTPGFADLVDKTRFILKAVETALFVISPSMGIGNEEKKIWEYTIKEGISRAIFINKIEEEFETSPIIKQIEEEFEISCLPFQLPLNEKTIVDLIELEGRVYKEGKAEKKQVSKEEKEKLEGYRKKLIESAAETDDALIEKYLANEELSKEEIKKGLRDGLVKNSFIPLFCGSALKNMGIDLLLNTIIDFFPSPLMRKSVKGESADGKEIERKISVEEPLSAFVFQTFAEAHLGEVNLFKVYSGTLSSGSTVYNSTKNKEEKIGQIYLMQGNKREEVPQILAGDIGAITKLKNTDTGNTLCKKEALIKIPPPEFPEPTTSIAIKTQKEKDEQKLSVALARLIKVDPLLKMEIDKESSQTVLSGTGEMHLQIAIERLKEEFGIDVRTEEPRIPYRETITVVAESQGRYKRQTGGHGQYGDVWLRIKSLPRGEGIKFADKIRGGVVPTRFIPSVEKGVREATKKGFLASYPLVDMEVTLFDGTYHPVDSSDIAFQIAASIGLKKAVEKAKPTLLEPIMEIEVEIPDEFLGETNGDLNSRRGRIMEVESFKNRKKIKAYVPAAELHNYSTRLRSITQGKGTFRKKFSHYERAPEEIARKVIAQAQADKESK